MYVNEAREERKAQTLEKKALALQEKALARQKKAADKTIKKEQKENHIQDHNLSESTRVTQRSVKPQENKFSPYEDLIDLDTNFNLTFNEMLAEVDDLSGEKSPAVKREEKLKRRFDKFGARMEAEDAKILKRA